MEMTSGSRISHGLCGIWKSSRIVIWGTSEEFTPEGELRIMTNTLLNLVPYSRKLLPHGLVESVPGKSGFLHDLLSVKDMFFRQQLQELTRKQERFDGKRRRRDELQPESPPPGVRRKPKQKPPVRRRTGRQKVMILIPWIWWF